MAAILGLDDDSVADVCNAAAQGEVVEAVNFNAPGQVVIAGHKTAVDRAIELAKASGAKRALPLPVSVPAHSALMREAGEALRDALAAAAFSDPTVTVIGASDARPYGDADDIRARLSTQVYSPVQWVRTTEAIVAGGADTVVECGPGKVLAGLVRRIDRDVTVVTIDNVDNLEKALQG
jgi:[acyl-carrier-protein] S-malonyltransferase